MHSVLPQATALRRLPSHPAHSLVARSGAIGALALGAFAIGALAIGALAIGRLAIGRVRIRRMEIDELVVGNLRVTERLALPPTSAVGRKAG